MATSGNVIPAGVNSVLRTFLKESFSLYVRIAIDGEFQFNAPEREALAKFLMVTCLGIYLVIHPAY